MKIVVTDRQKTLQVNGPGIRRLVQYGVKRASPRRPDAGWQEISLVLTDDEGIRSVNQRHLASSDVTDVISFRYEPMPGDNESCSGEIIVNVCLAAERKGGRHLRRISREMALYVLHGCDHLCGRTDRTRKGRDSMRRRELAWLRQAERLGYLDDLIKVSK